MDNGKNGNLAFAMAAAASLTPDGEKSIYAKARDICAMTSFYTTTFMLHGHTGGGIGEIWRSAAMGLLAEKKPLQYREFMDHRKWHYDLSRRFDGSFGILGGAGYDNERMGRRLRPEPTPFPRKTLRITGAPPSKFSKTYQLPPARGAPRRTTSSSPWIPSPTRTANVRTSPAKPSTKDSAKPLIIRLNEKELSDDEIRRYVYHPEYLIRNMVSNNAAGLSCDYMFPKPGKRVRPELLEEFARHSRPARPQRRPPRRHQGLRSRGRLVASASSTSPSSASRTTRNPGSSRTPASPSSQRGTPDMIVPHVDLLLSYLKHPEQWLQNGALMALANVVTDERCYEKVLPAHGRTHSAPPRAKAPPAALIRACAKNSPPPARKSAISPSRPSAMPIRTTAAPAPGSAART